MSFPKFVTVGSPSSAKLKNYRYMILSSILLKTYGFLYRKPSCSQNVPPKIARNWKTKRPLPKNLLSSLIFLRNQWKGNWNEKLLSQFTKCVFIVDYLSWKCNSSNCEMLLWIKNVFTTIWPRARSVSYFVTGWRDKKSTNLN